MVLLAVASVAGACENLDDDGIPATTAPDASVTTEISGQSSAGQNLAENILFRDDFQDGDSKGWEVAASWLVQQDGDLYTFDTSGEGYAYVPAGVGWDDDYALRLSYLLSTGTVAFSFDATQDGRYYVAVGDGLMSLVREDATGDRTVLTQAEAPEIGVQHYLVMAKDQGTIQVYVDRTLWLVYEDQAPLTAGTIMVGSVEGTNAWVDNVMVNKLLVSLPQRSPAVAAVDPGQVVEPPEEGASLGELPEFGEDVPDLPDDNLPEFVLLPSATFTARPDDGSDSPGAQELSVDAGTAVILEWTVQDASSQLLDGVACLAAGSKIVVPSADTEYELDVVGWDGQTYNQYVNVTVDASANVVLVGPDLSIQVSVTPQGGRDVTVRIEVSNRGTAATQATVYWYAHERSGFSDFADSLSLASGVSRVMEFDYTYGARGTMHWGARVTTEPPGADLGQSDNFVNGTVTVGQ